LEGSVLGRMLVRLVNQYRSHRPRLGCLTVARGEE
jgi:hypothetical protein